MRTARLSLTVAISACLIACQTMSPTPTQPPVPATPVRSAYADGVTNLFNNVLGIGEMSANSTQLTNTTQLWVISGSDVTAVDLATGQTHEVTVNGSEIDGIYAADDAVWAADFGGDQLIKIDPATYTVTDRIDMPSPEAVIEANGFVWVANHHEGTVTIVDPTTDKTLKTMAIGQPGANGPSHMAAGMDSIWVGLANELEVVRIDPHTDTVSAHIAVPGDGPCGDIAIASNAVWAVMCSGQTDAVAKIDPTTNETVASVTLATQGLTPLILDSGVWVPVTHEIDQLDATTAQVTGHVAVPELAAGGWSIVIGETLYVSDTVQAVKAIPLSQLTAP